MPWQLGREQGSGRSSQHFLGVSKVLAAAASIGPRCTKWMRAEPALEHMMANAGAEKHAH